MTENPKITFYVEADVKQSLDSLDPGVKSHTINKLLRQGFQGGASLDERIAKLEQVAQHDACAIGAIRHVLMNHFGQDVARELENEFNNVLLGLRKPV